MWYLRHMESTSIFAEMTCILPSLVIPSLTILNFGGYVGLTALSICLSQFWLLKINGFFPTLDTT